MSLPDAMTRWSAVVLAATLASALHACGPLGGRPDAGSARPTPTAAGTAIGTPASKGIDALGGRLASEDGRLTLEVPPGVVSSAVELRIQEITNTAPTGVGSSYRLEPEGLTFARPVTITFEAGATGLSVDQLSVAYQERDGYWLRVPWTDLTRDSTRRTVTVSTRHFSGWTLVTGPSARDLHGAFTLSSSLDLPYAGATGTADLTFAGEDPGVAFYLLSGTVTLPSPLAVGSESCEPTPPETPALALRTNIAELRAAPPAFLWGLSGHWNLTCTGPAGQRADSLLTAFDTQGISAFDCTRGYDGGTPPVFGQDRLSGVFAVNCGSKGTMSATWDFLSAACGTACASASPCHTAAIECVTGTAVCTDTGFVPDGEDGGCPPPQTCLGGVCAP